MKSPIVYYGGKSSMVPFILPLIPAHEVYTETYFGGGSVYWSKNKVVNETINDRLDIVINFYSQLKNNFAKLKKLIDATLMAKSLHARALFMIKNKEMFDELQLAWAFWLVSNFSYGNKIGGGMKYSNDISIAPPRVMHNMKKDFTERLVARIEHAQIENRDAIECQLSRNVVKAFHYLAPPYPGADQGHYRGYSFEDFEKQLVMCEQIKGKFLLSNYNSEMLDSYVEKNNWWKKEVKVNNKGMRKDDKTKCEVLVANYVPTGHQTFDF